MSEGARRFGWGDAILLWTTTFALAVLVVALLGIDAPWLTVLLSQGVVVYFLTVMMLLVVLAAFVSFEEGRASAHEVAIVAVLSAASIALRVAFAPLPQVQPCTFIILTAGVVYGARAGFMVGALTALVSNFFLGQGFWTPFQMFAWGAAGAFGGLLAYARPDVGRWGLAVAAFVWGFLYGWITNVSQFFFYEVSWRSFVVVYFYSFWFDLVHAVANFVIALVFANEVLWVLRRYRRRFEVERIDDRLDGGPGTPTPSIE